MLTRIQKEELIKELADKLKRQKSLVFTDFSGLGVSDIQDLRRKLKEVDAEYKITKKTLIKLALEKAKKEIDVAQFRGQIALVFGYKDPITLFKVISEFSKAKENLKISGGLMENKFLTKEEIEELAELPSKEELLARIVGGIRAPISGFINVVQGNIFGFINLLKQLK